MNLTPAKDTMRGLDELGHFEDRAVAVRWECLAGDTSAFGFKIAFIDDPDGQQGVSADISPSWAAFQIWVNGQNLCSHWEEGERIESAHWYLLPLLEWFARHWESLLHEERLPCEAVGDAWTGLHETRFPPSGLDEDDELAWDAAWHDWWSRHAIHAARDGGLIPDVLFRGHGDDVEVSWGNTPIQGMPDHFRFALRQGTALFDRRTVAEPLYDALEKAAAYLSSIAPWSSRVADLTQAIRRLPRRLHEGRARS